MRERRQTVDVSFDGEEFEAYADETILQAARRLGVRACNSQQWVGAPHRGHPQSSLARNRKFRTLETLHNVKPDLFADGHLLHQSVQERLSAQTSAASLAPPRCTTPRTFDFPIMCTPLMLLT